MDLEKLTKHQTILLALLLSFVTSIATGIVTVTLMDQAPPAITNTINRVVERTVEVVVPNPEGQQASVITKETTVVVKEEDLVTDAIDLGLKYLVRIEVEGEEEGQYETTALGSIVSSDGMVVTDSSYIVEGGEYFMKFLNKRYPLNVLGQDEENGIAILSVIVDEEDPVTFKPASFAKMSELKLGQTLINLGGIKTDSISIGIISGFRHNTIEPVVSDDEEEVEKTTKAIKVLSRIETDVNGITLSGGPNMNVYGDMIGMTISSKSGAYIAPSNLILSFIKEVQADNTKEPE